MRLVYAVVTSGQTRGIAAGIERDPPSVGRSITNGAISGSRRRNIAGSGSSGRECLEVVLTVRQSASQRRKCRQGNRARKLHFQNVLTERMTGEKRLQKRTGREGKREWASLRREGLVLRRGT